MRKVNKLISQKAEVTYHLKSDFHPIIILLSAFGINAKKNAQKVYIFLAIFFHAVWIFMLVSTVACCFDKRDATFYVFTVIKYSCALLTWWILYKKRKDLAHLINSVKIIQGALKRSHNARMKKWIFGASVFSVFAVFSPGAFYCIKLLIQDKYPLFCCLHYQNVMTQKDKARSLHFLLLSGSNYATRGLAYIVIIFYSCYCMELKYLALYLKNKAKRRLNASSTEIGKVFNEDNFFCLDDIKTCYFKLVKLLMEFENTFSSLVFLQIVSSFFEILRIETVIIRYFNNRWKFDIILPSVYWSSVGISSLLAIILSADSIQNACHAARIVLQDYGSTFSSETILKSLQLQVVYLQDKRFIRLTAWGMFQVQNDLFLSLIALYVTYGVLLAQITF